MDGSELGVLHETWRQGTTGYFDPMPGVDPAGARYRRLVNALHGSDLAVVQRDKGEGMARDGYIGVFRFKDLVIGADNSISLTFTERYADPR